MTPLNKMDRRILLAYWTGATIVFVIAAIGAAIMIARDYDSRLVSARQSGLILARALSEHTTQIFEKLSALSLAVAEDQATASGTALSDRLKWRAAAEPAAEAIAVVDRSGKVTATSIAALPVGTDLSDTDAFRLHSTSDTPRTLTSRAYDTGAGGKGNWPGWTMDFTRRLDDAAGSFAGFVLIVIDGPFLYGFYDRLEQEQNKLLGLIGGDGVVRASNALLSIGKDVGPYIQKQIADARDPPHPFLAAARVLQRRQAERGRKLPPGSETAGVGHRRGKRRGRDEADAGNCAQPLRQLIGAKGRMNCHDSLDEPRARQAEAGMEAPAMTKKPIVIRNAEDLTAALARAEELAGCTNDSEEGRELAEIEDAVEVYEDALRVLQNVEEGEGPKIWEE